MGGGAGGWGGVGELSGPFPIAGGRSKASGFTRCRELRTMVPHLPSAVTVLPPLQRNDVSMTHHPIESHLAGIVSPSRTIAACDAGRRAAKRGARAAAGQFCG